MSKTTTLKLLVEIGAFCERYQDRTLRNLNCKMIQADELWALVGAKPKHTASPGLGDVLTFTAMDADSKLMVSWLVGNRTIDCAYVFMRDVASRLGSRVQLTTDGHYMYLTAVEGAFGWNGVDFARLVKRYAMEIHAHALHFFAYNFRRPDQTLAKWWKGIKTTPAMVEGLTYRVWTIKDLLGLMDPKRSEAWNWTTTPTMTSCPPRFNRATRLLPINPGVPDTKTRMTIYLSESLPACILAR